MRPKLESNTKPEIFLAYYWLKQELVDFCKKMVCLEVEASRI